MWLIKYRKDGERPKENKYKTERGLQNRIEELNNDPLVVSIRIFKEVTYGEQMDLFNPNKLPF